MWWRKRRQERPAQRLVRTKILHWMGKLQSYWAEYLAKKERHWSMRQKKIYCGLFCLIAGGGSMLVILHTVLTPMNTSISGWKERHALSRPPLLRPDPEPSWNTADTVAVHAFRHWIDSLSTTEAGRRQLDSCWQERPGLLDSFIQLEKMIH